MKHYKLLTCCLMILASLISCHPEHTEMFGNEDIPSSNPHSIQLNIKPFINAWSTTAETRATDIMQVADLWMLVFTDSTDEGELVQKIHFDAEAINNNTISISLNRPTQGETYHALFLANAKTALEHLGNNDIMVEGTHKVSDLRDFLNNNHDDGNGASHNHRIWVDPTHGPEQKIGTDNWYIPSCSKWIQIYHDTQPNNIGGNGVINLHPRVAKLSFHMQEAGVTIHSVRVVNIPKYLTASDLGDWNPGTDPQDYYDLKAHTELGGTANYFIASGTGLNTPGAEVNFTCYLPSTYYGTVQADESDFENNQLKGIAYPMLEVKLSNNTHNNRLFYFPIGEHWESGNHVKEGMHYSMTLNEEDFVDIDPADNPSFVRFYGNEYINLGFAPKDHMYFRIKAAVDGGLTQDTYLFGAKDGSSNACAINYKAGNYWSAEVNDKATANQENDLNNPGHVMTFDFSVENFEMQAEEEPDTDIVSTNATSFGTINQSLILGGLNNGGTFSNGFKGDIYSIEGWMTDQWGWGENKFLDLTPGKLTSNSIGFKDKQNTNKEYAKETASIVSTPSTGPADDNDNSEKYVSFDGNHYVDLGITAKEAYEGDYTFYVRLASDGTNMPSSGYLVLGAREDFNTKDFALLLNNSNKFRASYNSNSRVFLNSTTNVHNTPITISLSRNSINHVIGIYDEVKNGTSVINATASIKTITWPGSDFNHRIYLGGINFVKSDGLRYNYYSYKGKIIYLICKKPNGDIVRKLEPDMTTQQTGKGCTQFIDTQNGNTVYPLKQNEQYHE